MDLQELKRSKLSLIERLGSGQFGDVYKGKYESLNVAIKTIKINSTSDDSFKQDFLREAEIMSQFNHDHIIKLIGICKDTPCLLVIELAEYGQLKSYLKANVNKLELDLLILYCYQICKALVYLENKNYVHRDIAARNILLCNKEYVKLSDFGLTRYIDEIYQETESQLKLPVKWLAIESLCFRIFTSKSDVWMFSVCMWEIFEFGDKPYQNFKNKDMIKVLESGERLNKPDYCPNELYSLMLECWNYQPNERPNFSLIEKTLKILYNKYQTQKTKEKPFKSNLRSSDESDHEDEKWLEESFKEISINVSIFESSQWVFLEFRLKVFPFIFINKARRTNQIFIKIKTTT